MVIIICKTIYTMWPPQVFNAKKEFISKFANHQYQLNDLYNQLPDSKCEGSTIPLNEFPIGYKYQKSSGPFYANLISKFNNLSSYFAINNHLTCDPSNTEVDVYKENSIPGNSLHSDLSHSPNTFWGAQNLCCSQ